MVTGLSNTMAGFTLTFTGQAVLPLKITSFNGTTNGVKNKIFWKVENIISVEKTILETSVDGITFGELYTLDIAAGSGFVTGSFDDNQLAPVKYYRLKVINKNGSVEYSNVILLKQNGKLLDVVISPNPVKDKMTITFFKTGTGSTTFNLLDASGKLVWQERIEFTTGWQSHQINLINGLNTGVYILQIKDNEKISSHKIIVN
jgi:hypothetical protein